jgi:molybdate transport system substrate-binding protein
LYSITRRGAFVATLMGLMLFGCSPAPRAPREPVTVFAAASLTDALGEIAADYEAETGQPVRLSFAASGAVARQIQAGAPADVVVLADVKWMDRLEEGGFVASGSRLDLLRNSLVVIAGETETVTGNPLDWVLLDRRKLAIGDPESVPAGAYARTWLEGLGRWQGLQASIVTAADVRAVRSFVSRGEAQLGVVYKSDVTGVAGLRIVLEPPADQQPSILYPAAIARTAGPDAAGFLTYLQGDKARAAFARAGFAPAR